jgi:putative DNA primase/helicase
MTDSVTYLDKLDARAERKQRRDTEVPNAITDTDLANARRFADRCRGKAHYTPERGWLIWDGKRWKPDERELAVMTLAKDVVEGIYNEISTAPDRKVTFEWARRSQAASRLRDMLLLARSEPGIPASFLEFDADPWLFNCGNGTIDLKTGTLQHHDPADKLARLAPVDFNPEADFNLWDGFLWCVLGGNLDLYAYVRRLAGYCLTGLTTEQTYYFLFGTGANGKSVFLETIAALMGDYHIALRAESLMVRGGQSIPNDIAQLAGARLVTVSEVVEGGRLNETLVKDLTGGDTISARFMRQEFFKFQPNLKLLMRGNHRPVITGTDEGIWRRLHLIPFEVQIPEAERDPHLVESLKGQLTGILAWGVGGLGEWRSRRLDAPASVRTAVAGYREDMDIIGAFLTDHCIVDASATVKVSDLYHAYHEWAGTEAVQQRRFGEAMTERGFIRQRTDAARLYRGVSLKG